MFRDKTFIRTNLYIIGQHLSIYPAFSRHFSRTNRTFPGNKLLFSLNRHANRLPNQIFLLLPPNPFFFVSLRTKKLSLPSKSAHKKVLSCHSARRWRRPQQPPPPPFFLSLFCLSSLSPLLPSGLPPLSGLKRRRRRRRRRSVAACNQPGKRGRGRTREGWGSWREPPSSSSCSSTVFHTLLDLTITSHIKQHIKYLWYRGKEMFCHNHQTRSGCMIKKPRIHTCTQRYKICVLTPSANPPFLPSCLAHELSRVLYTAKERRNAIHCDSWFSRGSASGGQEEPRISAEVPPSSSSSLPWSGGGETAMIQEALRAITDTLLDCCRGPFDHSLTPPPPLLPLLLPPPRWVISRP